MKEFLKSLQEHPGRVIVISTVLYLLLGSWQGGLNLDAAMYASVARNIAESGNWLSQRYTDFYFTQFAEHPPLAIWGMALMFKIFGATDTASRIIGALSALGSVALIYLIGREALGKAYGFLAAFILLICVNFISLTNSALLDGPVTFFMILAYWSVANPEKAKQRLPLGGAALGLAFLCKGLVAAPAFVALFLYVILFRRDLLKTYQPYLAAALALALPGLYVLIEMNLGPNYFWGHYFGSQLGDILAGLRPALEAEWYEFFFRFLKLFLPWSALVLVGLAFIIKNREKKLAFVSVALLSALIVFSFSKYVFNHYFAPVYPLGALVAAYPIILFLEHKEKTLGRFPLYFLAVWLMAFSVIPFTNLTIHHLRAPEVNALNPAIQKAIANSPTKNGAFIGQSWVNWNMVAQSSWYWNSSLLFVADTAYNVEKFLRDERFAYLVTPVAYAPAAETADRGGLVLAGESGPIRLYTRPAQPPTAD